MRKKGIDGTSQWRRRKQVYAKKRDKSKGRNRLTRPRKKSIRPPSPTPLPSHLLPVLWSILPHYFFYSLFVVLTCREKRRERDMSSSWFLSVFLLSMCSFHLITCATSCRVFIRLTSSEWSHLLTWEDDILVNQPCSTLLLISRLVFSTTMSLLQVKC